MAKKREPVRSRDVQELKYLGLLLPLLDELHEVGCQRDKAGNRKLHYDQYCLLVLLCLFSPLLRSLRALQQASTLRKVQKLLGCPRTSLGSLSEATDVFDPQRLEGIIGQLLAQVPSCQRIGREQVPGVLTAVDGSVIKTLASLAEAAYLRDKNGTAHSGWRFHTHFEIDRRVPVRMDVTTALIFLSHMHPAARKSVAQMCVLGVEWLSLSCLTTRLKNRRGAMCRPWQSHLTTF